MEATMSIKGADVLLAALKTMQASAEREVGFNAIGAGARELIRIAKANAPKKTGKLRRSFGTRKNKRRINEITMSVGIKKGKQYAFYAHFIEFGTKPHSVLTASKGVLSSGKETFGKVTKIKGVAAKPFLGKALEEGMPRVIDAIKYRLAADLIRRGVL